MSCSMGRPVHTRQPTFMSEHAMTHDRPKATTAFRLTMSAVLARPIVGSLLAPERPRSSVWKTGPDPEPTAGVLRSGHRNLCKQPFGSRQRGAQSAKSTTARRPELRMCEYPPNAVLEGVSASASNEHWRPFGAAVAPGQTRYVIASKEEIHPVIISIPRVAANVVTVRAEASNRARPKILPPARFSVGATARRVVLPSFR